MNCGLTEKWNENERNAQKASQRFQLALAKMLTHLVKTGHFTR